MILALPTTWVAMAVPKAPPPKMATWTENDEQVKSEVKFCLGSCREYANILYIYMHDYICTYICGYGE